MAASLQKLFKLSTRIRGVYSNFSSSVLVKNFVIKNCSYSSSMVKNAIRYSPCRAPRQLSHRNDFMSIENHQISKYSKYHTLTPKGTLEPVLSIQTPTWTNVRTFPTLNQIQRGKRRTKKRKQKSVVAKKNQILNGPQRKGVCVKVFIRKPKKPNSANRKCALLRLNNGQTIIAYIPGEKASLQEHGVVLFEGGRVQDCPGVRYKIIRGKYDIN